MIAAAVGFLISLANVVAGYRVVASSVGKPSRLFMASVFGSMVVRLFAMLALLWFFVSIVALPPVSLAASLMISYFVFMIVEIQVLIHSAGFKPRA